MLTMRGSFLIGVTVYGFAMAVLMSLESLALICLAVLVWIWIQWLAFAVMQVSNDRFLDSIRRQVDGHEDPAVTLVADREYEVQLTADLKLLRSGFRVTLQDLIPDTMLIRGNSSAVINSGWGGWLGRFWAQPMLRQIYELETPICGRVQLPGVQVEISDRAGLFRTEQFAAVPQSLTVLPFLIRPQTTVSVLKHNNLQRHLGHHRHRSAGISSELHGIRDYQTGDPPRTIAWKPTARLGKVMTCEFENEVPIRATLLVDLAAYQFQGRPQPTAGDRAISTTASIAKLLLADRDPIAAVLLNDQSDRPVMRIDHGSGERQLARLMQYLLRASNPHPPLDHFYIHDLVQVVFENASRRFPQLFDERYNVGRTPFRWLGRKGSDPRLRRALAIVLAHLLDLPYGAALRMQHDDRALRSACLAYVNRFSVHSQATTVALDPPYRNMGQWLAARNEITVRLCEHLTQLRMRAKDNELFVLVAPEPHDLLGCEMIEASVKQAIAARHRVMYIAPEPPLVGAAMQDVVARRIMDEAATGIHRRASSLLGERLSIVGATFARIDDPRLMGLVAAEIGVLQSAGNRGSAIGRGRR